MNGVCFSGFCCREGAPGGGIVGRGFLVYYAKAKVDMIVSVV